MNWNIPDHHEDILGRMTSTYLLESEKVWEVWLRIKTMEEIVTGFESRDFLWDPG